jgi:type II secretory pathway pseudopilin PulG
MRPPTYRPRLRPGITLIEILIVLAIMAGMMGMSLAVVGSMTNAQLRAEAMRMSGALRMVYGRAAINGLRYELQINLDENSYSVACGDGNLFVDPGTSDTAPKDEDEDEDPEADPFNLGTSRATLEDCSEPLLDGYTLKRGVQIVRVLTSHHRDPVESGVATVAYFPNGFVERTLIWLEQDDAVLTLAIDPMSGRVRVFGEDLEVPDDFFEVEEDR